MVGVGGLQRGSPCRRRRQPQRICWEVRSPSACAVSTAAVPRIRFRDRRNSSSDGSIGRVCALAELRAVCAQPRSTATWGAALAGANGGEGFQSPGQHHGLASEHDGLDTRSQKPVGEVQLFLLTGSLAQYIERSADATLVAEAAQRR
jgi:hypothetical protein